MPNRIFILLIFALIPSLATAQAAEDARNRFGVFAGVNFAGMDGDMTTLGEALAFEFENQFGGTWTSSKSGTTGLGVGVSFLVALSPTLGIQLEGQYIRRGAKVEAAGRDIPTSGLPSSLDVKTTFKLDHLEVPLLLRLSPSPGAKTRPVFFAGPVIGLRVGANLEAEVLGQSIQEDASDLIVSSTFGLIGGVGLDTMVGENSHLLIQARYYRSLKNQFDSSTAESKSGDFGFFLGFEFPLTPDGEVDDDRPHY